MPYYHQVIKTLCFLKDMNDFAAVNKIYGSYFTHAPARSAVEVARLPKGMVVHPVDRGLLIDDYDVLSMIDVLFEIECVALE